MKRLILLGLVFFLGCQPKEKKISGLLGYIPGNSFCTIKINDPETFKNDLRNNDFLKQFEKSVAYDDFTDFISRIKHIQTDSELLLCFNEVGKENFEYTFLFQKSDNYIKKDSSNTITSQRYTYEEKTIDEVTIEGKIAYHAVLDETIVISSSKLLIENIIRQTLSSAYMPEKSFQRVFESTDETSVASVIIDGPESKSFFNYLFPENEFVTDNLPDNWFGLDLKIDQKKLNFNGVSIAKDSTGSSLSAFYNSKGITNTLPQITPVNALGIVSFTYDNWDDFKQSLTKLEKNTLQAKKNYPKILNYTDEAGIIYTTSGKVASLHTTNIEGVKNELEIYSSEAGTHRNITVKKFEPYTLLVDEFRPLITDIAANFYVILDDYIVFADKLPAIHFLIDNYQNKTTLTESPSFEILKKDLNDQSAFMVIGINPEFRNLLEKEGSTMVSKSLSSIELKDYPLFAVQLVADNDFFHINGVISRIKASKQSGNVSQLFSVILETEVLNTPQFISNHRTDEKDIIVQDNLNQLYLISNEGNIRWKKKLEGPIISEVKQVDLYKNGRLQLAFNTENKLYIVDIKGDDVSPFPLDLKTKAKQQLSVFDYDNNRNYRFVVCGDKEVYMYDGQGEIVKGFTFNESKTPIINSPVHFRVSGKDYLVFTMTDGIQILSRRGKPRVKVKGEIEPSGNPVFLYNNLITTTDASGNLVQIDFKGNITQKGLGLRENHKIVTSSRSLVSLSDNVLTIKGKPIEMDFGVYVGPQFFYVNNKIYIAITDLQINKVYLFDSQGDSISDFPVYGNSAIDLADLKNNKKIAIVTEGEKNALLVYAID